MSQNNFLTVCLSIYVILNEGEMVEISSVVESGVVLLEYFDRVIRCTYCE